MQVIHFDMHSDDVPPLIVRLRAEAADARKQREQAESREANKLRCALRLPTQTRRRQAPVPYDPAREAAKPHRRRREPCKDDLRPSVGFAYVVHTY